MYEDFTIHGKAAIETVRQKRPHDYLRLIASMLTKEFGFTLPELPERSPGLGCRASVSQFMSPASRARTEASNAPHIS
jgi:hypothetical protein